MNGFEPIVPESKNKQFGAFCGEFLMFLDKTDETGRIMLKGGKLSSN